jgi:hypothetical protein
MSDGWSDVNTGENAFKYTITFQPQGDLWVNAYVGTATRCHPGADRHHGLHDRREDAAERLHHRPSVGCGCGPVERLPGLVLLAVLEQRGGYRLTQNGVVTGRSAGTATITATWKATSTASTPLSITIA